MRNKKIGVFDSGFGGLTVLKSIRAKLPEYDYIYLGDSARAPYGNRGQKEIYEFTKQAVDFLFNHNCELIILACNTASAEALRKIQQEYLPKNHPKKRVLGVVIPTCEYVVEKGYKKVGVMATASTVESKSYIAEIKKLDQDAQVTQKACPLLVPIIESGQVDKKALSLILDDYLKYLENTKAIILGCTHYEIIEKEITKKAKDSKVISQSKIVADKLADYLKKHPEIENKLSRNGKVKYYSTDMTNRFKEFGESIIESKITFEKNNLI